MRIAAQKINGLEIRANEVFSFWKQIGKPTQAKGYVVGREIREGCIIPVVAGGLCQLSNALYDAAVKANFVIIERHKHSKIIKGSLAEQDRDATVKWNYIDLRFRASIDFRIEISITQDTLQVVFKAGNSLKKMMKAPIQYAPNAINDCYSCGNAACFKHPTKLIQKQKNAITTYILDEKWIEFDDYVQSTIEKSSTCIIPLQNNKLIKSERYNWKAIQNRGTQTACFSGVYRALRLRFASKNENLFALNLVLDQKIARAIVEKIPIETTHFVIAQNLLPFIYETGALGGRTFDVLMTRLPLQKLHERLNFAQSKHAKSQSLTDFRASDKIIELENKALNQAAKIISPHTEIAQIFNRKIEKLVWRVPSISNKNNSIDLSLS